MNRLLGSLLILALSGCGGGLAVNGAATQKAGPGETLSLADAQVADIVLVANTVDVEAAQLAQEKTKNADVKKFADLMVGDHTAVNQQATDLATRLHLTPATNPVSQQLRAGGDANLANLRKLDGAAFDKAYVANEIAYHKAVLGAIDKVLIPQAKNKQLHDLIVAVRPAFAAHLDHAQQLGTMLGVKAGTAVSAN